MPRNQLRPPLTGKAQMKHLPDIESRLDTIRFLDAWMLYHLGAPSSGISFTPSYINDC